MRVFFVIINQILTMKVLSINKFKKSVKECTHCFLLLIANHYPSKKSRICGKYNFGTRKKLKPLILHNHLKVAEAFQFHKISDDCFKGSTGYGYGDYGRDTLIRYMPIYLVRRRPWSGLKSSREPMPFLYVYLVFLDQEIGC